MCNCSTLLVNVYVDNIFNFQNVIIARAGARSNLVILVVKIEIASSFVSLSPRNDGNDVSTAFPVANWYGGYTRTSSIELFQVVP